MAEICRQASLPPFPPLPPLLSVSNVFVPLSTTRGRDEAGVLFCCNWLSPFHFKKWTEGVFFSSPLTCAHLRSYTTEDCPKTRCSLGKPPEILFSQPGFLARPGCRMTGCVFALGSGTQEHVFGQWFGKCVLMAHLVGGSRLYAGFRTMLSVQSKDLTAGARFERRIEVLESVCQKWSFRWSLFLTGPASGLV